MTSPSFDQWIRNAATAPPAESEFTLAGLPPDVIESVGSDLDDILASTEKVCSTLNDLLRSDPSNESLESVLVDSEIELHHAVHHWRRLASTLRANGLWMDTDLGDVEEEEEEEHPNAS